MKLNEESNLILRITQLGLKHKKFTISQVIAMLKLDKDEEEMLVNGMASRTPSTNNPNHILVPLRQMGIEFNEHEFSLAPTAFYNYVDYLEIKEAKRQSSKAFIISIIAFIASVVVGGIQIYLQLQQK